MDAADVEARLKGFFEEDPRGAVAVYLFGSVARGDAGPASDVDVGAPIRRLYRRYSAPAESVGRVAEPRRKL